MAQVKDDETLREHLERRGLTQSYVCKHSDVDSATMARMVNNENTYHRPDQFTEVARALDVDREEVVEMWRRGKETADVE